MRTHADLAIDVICDETNNTQEIIDRNEMVARICITPIYCLEYLRLTPQEEWDIEEIIRQSYEVNERCPEWKTEGF